jgi:hypothetical protein
MRKPNLAVYYFKNAMEKLDGGGEVGNGGITQQKGEAEKELANIDGIPQPQVFIYLLLEK